MLFEVPEEKPDKESAGGGLQYGLEHRLGDSAKIESVLMQVQDNCCVHWVTEGDWSMHDLLIGLLMMAGPSDVFLSSYAFSEYPARILADLKGRKIILDLHCLIDSRIDKRSASALTMVESCATRCKMVNTHAKVTILLNAKLPLVVIGSANYTQNKRYEAGVIIANAAVVNFHKNWMENEFAKS